MSIYYDIGKPFSRENWNKLIRDINDLVTSPPGGCLALIPLDEVDPEHIWTQQDVEDVRDKLREACFLNEFEEDLSNPWRKSIIDEIEANMYWCDCESVIETIHLETVYPELASPNGDCGVAKPRVGELLSDVIDGVQVAPPGYEGRSWDYTIVEMHDSAPEEWWRENRTQVIETGPISCEGKIEYGSANPNRRLYTALYTSWSKHPAYACDHLVNTTSLQSAQNSVDYKIAHEYRLSMDLTVIAQSGTPVECEEPDE